MNRRLRRLAEQLEHGLPSQDEPAPELTTGQAKVPTAPMPGELVAAAHAASEGDASVRLELAGASVVAVLGGIVAGGEGDPREWWTAIWQLAQPEPGRPRGTGLRLLPLPAGLAAVAVTSAAGGFVLAVSDSVEPDRQRRAARTALDAVGPARPTGPLAVLLARTRERSGGTRVHVVAAAAGTLALAALAAIAVTMTHHHQQDAGVRLADPGPGLAAPAPEHRAGPAGHGGGPRPVPGSGASGPGPSASAPGRTGKPWRSTVCGLPSGNRAAGACQPTGKPAPPASPSPRPGPTSGPTPGPSPSPTSSGPGSSPPPSSVYSPPPTATPTPTPSSSGSGCISILGIHLCL